MSVKSKFGSTGAAIEALGLPIKPDFHLAGNRYWEAMDRIAELESELAEKNEVLDKIDEITKALEPKIDNAAFKVDVLVDELASLREKNLEWEQSFELYHNAVKRGTGLWKLAPGHDPEVHPDIGKLVEWMVDHLETYRELLLAMVTRNPRLDPVWLQQFARKELAKMRKKKRC